MIRLARSLKAILDDYIYKKMIDLEKGVQMAPKQGLIKSVVRLPAVDGTNK